MKDERELDYVCKQKAISLQSLEQNQIGLSFEHCFCGNLKCACMPIGVPNNQNTNQRYFFYGQIGDAYIQWEHSNNNSKSQLFFPARGQCNKGKFNGSCQICKKYFKDYRDHINSVGHVMKLRQNQFEIDIKLLCQNIKRQTDKKERKIKRNQLKFNGKFANKEGKNKFSTRFQKKSRKIQVKLE